MQAFLNTLAHRGWTGLDVDLSLQRRKERAWDSMSTSAPNGAGTGYNPMVGTLLFQSHIQEGNKNLTGNDLQPSESMGAHSEGTGQSFNASSSPVYQGW